jgi:hypothetical protein
LSVFVLDHRQRAVMPCCEKRAHLRRERGRTVVHRRYPFTTTKLTAHGLPRGSCMRTRRVRALQTGDMVRAEVPTGKKAGSHLGRVAVRGSGSWRVGNADAINAKSCKLLHRADGYRYARQPALPPRPEERGLKRGRR